MHRCLISPSDWDSKKIRLSGEEEHHLFHVMRSRSGDEVLLFDGQGKEASAIVNVVVSEQSGGRKKHNSQHVELDLSSDVKHVSRDTPAITAIVALPKGKRMQPVIEKATELGVSRVCPVITERVVARPSEKQMEERLRRWESVALSAARQSGSCYVPEVMPVRDYSEIITECAKYDLFLVGSLYEDARDFLSVMRSEVSREDPIREVAFLVGPEGDLSDSEMRSALSAGALPVSFGKKILRVDTAALYFLSVLVYELRRG